jgi:hypothetical protein
MFIIVSHDSAVCPKSGIELAFGALPLRDWQQLELRMPYIAVNSSMQEAGLEYIGDKNHRIALELPHNQAAIVGST